MAKEKIKINKLGRTELLKNLREKQTALRTLRFGGSSGGKTSAGKVNVKAARELRREVARILTALAGLS